MLSHAMGRFGTATTAVAAAVRSRSAVGARRALHASGRAVFAAMDVGSLPHRDAQLAALKDSEANPFDVVIVGAGATGVGCAMDAASRGLNVALLERGDFASGTSSKSTKLIHGGVRYLEKAFFNLDYGQYKLVREALHERNVWMNMAPHLSSWLPIMLPVFKWWQVPYFYAGVIAYDLVSGLEGKKRSYLLGKSKSLEQFPMLRSDNLKASLVYFDGQFNDARACTAFALTAAAQGAAVANYVNVEGLVKSKNGYVEGVVARDMRNPDAEPIVVHGRTVINATGPFTDGMRQMDDPSTPTITAPSSGTHLTLPDYYSPREMGMLDPATSDGRVIFMLPWEGRTIAGTTDVACGVTDSPTPTEEDIRFILKEIQDYLSPDLNVRRKDVMSAWTGIRPLVSDPNAKNTEELSRDHIIHVADSNMITIAGGKWTTFRLMAQQTIDKAITVGRLSPRGPSQTESMKVMGAAEFSPTLFITLAQKYNLPTDIAKHLAQNYGDQAHYIGAAALDNFHADSRSVRAGTRLHPNYPFTEEEVRFAVREYACTVGDVICRRLRIAFLNLQVARVVAPRVAALMADELSWDDVETAAQLNALEDELATMAGAEPMELADAAAKHPDHRLALNADVRAALETFDVNKDKAFDIGELRWMSESLGLGWTEAEVQNVMAELGTTSVEGSVPVGRFLVWWETQPLVQRKLKDHLETGRGEEAAQLY